MMKSGRICANDYSCKVQKKTLYLTYFLEDMTIKTIYGIVIIFKIIVLKLQK